MLKQHENAISSAQRGIDAIIVYACWMLAYYIRFIVLLKTEVLFEHFVKIGLIQVGLVLYFFHKNGLYRSQRFNSRVSEILSVVKSNTVSFIALVIGLYFVAPERVSRMQLLIYFVISCVALIAVRLITRNILRSLRKRGYNLRHVVLIGDGPQLVDYVQTARRYKDCGISFRGWVNSGGLATNLGIKEIDTPFDAYRAQVEIDVIVIGHKNSDHHKTDEILK